MDYDTIDRIPDTPFRVVHNGIVGIGGYVNVHDGGFTFWDGSRTYDIDDSYEAAIEDDVVVFTSAEYESEFEFSELSENDAKLFAEADTLTTAEAVVEAAKTALATTLEYGA